MIAPCCTARSRYSHPFATCHMRSRVKKLLQDLGPPHSRTMPRAGINSSTRHEISATPGRNSHDFLNLKRPRLLRGSSPFVSSRPSSLGGSSSRASCWPPLAASASKSTSIFALSWTRSCSHSTASEREHARARITRSIGENVSPLPKSLIPLAPLMLRLSLRSSSGRPVDDGRHVATAIYEACGPRLRLHLYRFRSGTQAERLRMASLLSSKNGLSAVPSWPLVFGFSGSGS